MTPEPHEQLAIDMLSAADPVTEEDFRELAARVADAVSVITLQDEELYD